MSKGVYREIEFRGILKDITSFEKEQSLRRYRIEYEKLLTEYIKSCHKEKRLVLQLRNLRKEIRQKLDGTGKLRKQIEEKQKLFRELHSDSENTDKEIEALKTTINSKSIAIEKLVKEYDSTKILMKEGIGMGEKTDRKIKSLVYEVEKLTYERNQNHLKLENFVNGHVSCHIEKNRVGNERDVLERELSKWKRETQKLQKKTENYEKMRKEFSDSVNEFNQRRRTLERRKDYLDREISKDRETESSNTSKQNELVQRMKEEFIHTLNTRNNLKQTKLDLKLRVGENSILEVQKTHLTNELDRSQEENSLVASQLLKSQKLLFQLDEKKEKLTKALSEENKKKKIIVSNLTKVKLKLSQKLKNLEISKNKVEELKSKFDILIQTHESMDKEKSYVGTKFLTKVGEQRNLGIEVQSFKNQQKKQFDDLITIRKEIANYKQIAAFSQQNLHLAMEKFSNANLVIEKDQLDIKLEIQKKRKEKILVESIAFDKNLRFKRWKELDKEIKSAVTKYENFQSIINLGRKEVANLDKQIISENEEKKKFEELLIKRSNKLEKIKNLKKMKKKKKKKAYAEVLKLEKIIAETEIEKKRQIDELVKIQNDRDMLGIHLVRRNEEIEKLCDQLRMLESTMILHDQKYSEQFEKIKKLKEKNNQMNSQLDFVTSHISKYEHLNTEIKQLRDTLVLQQNKITFLKSEMNKKINFHPWRSSDEKKNYHLIKSKEKIRKKMNLEISKENKLNQTIKSQELHFIELKKRIQSQPSVGDAVVINNLKSEIKNRRIQKTEILRTLEHIKENLKIEKLQFSKFEEKIEKIKHKWEKKIEKTLVG